MLIPRLVVSLATLTLVACTTLRTVADGGEASAQYLQREKSGLSAGDRARLTLADGRQMVLRITSVDRESIQGAVEGGDQFVALRASDVVRIERSQVSAARTTGLILLSSLLLITASALALDGKVIPVSP